MTTSNQKKAEIEVIIRPAREEDIPAAYEVYRSLYGTPGCTWDEDYPSPEDPKLDFEAGGLYVAERIDDPAADSQDLQAASIVTEDRSEAETCRGKTGEIIGCVTGIAPETWEEDEIWLTLDCWDPRIKNPVDLARLGVKPEYQGLGIARALIAYVLEASKGKGFDGGIFLVSKGNPRAIEIYRSFGFRFCGETERWGEHWYCCDCYFGNYSAAGEATE